MGWGVYCTYTMKQTGKPMQDILNLKLAMQYGITLPPSQGDRLTAEQREVLRKVEALLTNTKKGQ